MLTLHTLSKDQSKIQLSASFVALRGVVHPKDYRFFTIDRRTNIALSNDIFHSFSVIPPVLLYY